MTCEHKETDVYMSRRGHYPKGRWKNVFMTRIRICRQCGDRLKTIEILEKDYLEDGLT